MDLLTIKILLLSIPICLLVVGIVWFILIKKDIIWRSFKEIEASFFIQWSWILFLKYLSIEKRMKK